MSFLERAKAFILQKGTVWFGDLFDFKTGLKHYSTWFWCAAILLLAGGLALPNLLLVYLPQAIPNLPPEWQQKAALALGLAGFVSKAILQNGVSRRIQAFKNWLIKMRDNVDGEVKKAVAKGAGIAALVAAAASLAIPALKQDEGLVLKNYTDVAGYVTACYGHRVYGKPLQSSYTEDECSDLLNDGFAQRAYQVLGCSPGLAQDRNALAAWSRFEYNTGAFCGSKPSMRRARALIASGKIKASCAEMSAWVYAKGKQLPGLIKRRARERQMCEATS